MPLQPSFAFTGKKYVYFNGKSEEPLEKFYSCYSYSSLDLSIHVNKGLNLFGDPVLLTSYVQYIILM
jgi:hypothetical protein